MNPQLSCIILNYNTAAMTKKVIDTFLEATKNLSREVILIDNGSTEKLPEVSSACVIQLRNEENLGFAAAVNQGIKVSRSDIILLLNSDVLVNQEAIEGLMSYIENNQNCGVLGPQMIFPQGDFQTSAGSFPSWRREFFRFSTLGKYMSGGTLLYHNIFTKNLFKNSIEVDWVTGGCMLIRKKVIDTIGFFDSAYFFGVEDIDFCFRAKQAGYSIIYLPTVSVIHHHGYSSGGHGSAFSLRLERKGMKYFLQKHFPHQYIFGLFVDMLYRLKIFYLENLKRSS